MPLSSLMGRLLTGYAVTLNRRHRRRGRLLQNRYKSILCQEEGADQGHREDLTGGCLIRSLGGWAAVGKALEQSLDQVKSDERILGSSDFVEQALAVSGKRYEPRYDLVRRGYDSDRIVNRVAQILEMEPYEVLSKGSKSKEVAASSLLSFPAASELGLSLTELARKLEMTEAGSGYAVPRGEKIAREDQWRLLKEVSWSFYGRPLLFPIATVQQVKITYS